MQSIAFFSPLVKFFFLRCNGLEGKDLEGIVESAGDEKGHPVYFSHAIESKERLGDDRC